MAALGALALTVSALGATSMIAAPAAHAAPGDPFPAGNPLVFVAQQTPTQLFKSTTNAAGDVQFTPEGTPTGIWYNAISYNQADNYLYGMVTDASAGFPVGSLIRIGQGGTVTRVGTNTYLTPGINGFNNGVFGPDGYFYVMSNAGSLAQVINVATGALVRTLTLSQALTTSDLTLAGGYFWGVRNSDATIPPVYVRVNPSTGAVTTFATTLPAGTYGAAWTFGNGNIGLSNNATGTVSQIAIANPASATPTFTIIASSSGPSSSANDGAGSAGLPTDLSILKTGPAALIGGSTASYTLTVTNNGPGNSSGFVVNDTVPALLTNVASPNAGCTVTGNNVRCVGGALANGASVSYTITASVPANVTTAVANTATVTANEQDPTPGNNTSTTSAGIPSIVVVKNAGTPVDVNGNGITDAGDTIQYTFDVTNTGQVPLSAITVNDVKVGAVTCPQTGLAVGATETCSAAAVYTITPTDVTAGAVNNTATVTGTTADGDVITSAPSTTSTPTTASAPGISVVKSASGPATYTVGEVVTYNFVVTNTDNVPLNTVTVNETTFTGTGTPPVVTCPASTLAVGAQLVCASSYTLTTDDVNTGSVTNTATATGTPTGSTTPITSTPSTVTIPITPTPALSVLKTASPTVVAVEGQTVTYSFRVTNTGNVTLTGVGVDDGGTTGTGVLSSAVCPATTLASGEIMTCTATYSVTQDDLDIGTTFSNTATASGTSPTGTPVTSPPSTAVVTPTQSPALTVVKTADATVAEAGQVVTYSFLVANTGNLTITDPDVDEVTFSGTGTLSAITCPAGTALAPGDTVTCTATYTVTQADVDSGAISNTATVTGTTPGGGTTDPSDPSTAVVPTDPAPALSVVKTADRQTFTAAGQVVTYSFLVTNTGNVTITDPTVAEGDFSGAGTLSPLACGTGTTALAPAASFVCTATYTVVDADLAAGDLTNSATVSGITPGGGPITSVPSIATVTNGFAPVPPAPTPAPTPAPGPAAAPVAPVPAAIAAVLAHTGADGVLPVAGVALLLMLLGGVLLVIRRRKHNRQHNAA